LKTTYPLPLPLLGKGVSLEEGLRPLPKIFPPLLEKERGIKGVRSIPKQKTMKLLA
jgi:hypothetical protein